MKSKEIPMTVDEYLNLAQPFGYKVEYWDGKAVYTPRECYVDTTLAITPQRVATPYRLQRVEECHETQIIDAFIAVFADSVEFCNWEQPDLVEFAETRIKSYFAGQRGTLHPASVLAFSPQNGELAGVALLLCKPKGGLNLDLLFVMPQHQRQKLATNMLSCLCNQLFAANINTLTSTYHACNQASQLWHQAMGFVDSYDDYYLRLKYGHLRNEAARREKLGSMEGFPELLAERDYWHARLKEHENLAE